MDHNDVSQTFFTQNTFAVLGYHDDLFLARFKNWKKLRRIMRVFSRLAVGDSKKVNVGLLEIQANESQAATNHNNERNQKSRQWFACKEVPHPLEGFLVRCKDDENFDSPSSVDSSTVRKALFALLVNPIRPRVKKRMSGRNSNIEFEIVGFMRQQL